MVLVPKLFSMYLMKKSLLLWWLFSGAESEDPTIENYQLHVYGLGKDFASDYDIT